MPSYPFAGVQSVASSTASQPVFGTTTTAAAVPTYDQFSGNVAGANPSMTTLTVSSTTGFKPGQYVLVATAATLGAVNPNTGQVKSIVSSTSMTVEGLTQAVQNGAYVLLNEVAESITVTQLSTNTGSLYVGIAPTVSATDSSVIADLIPSGSAFHAETTAWSHAYSTAQYFIAGTAGDKFVAQYTQG